MNFKSSADYTWWHKRKKPKHLPRYPHRSYTNDWVSWNDYLGTDNFFLGREKKVLRPFWEAVKCAQAIAAKHNLNTMRDWVQFSDHGKNLPPDMSTRPDVDYMEDFKGKGWGVWLGKDIRGKLIAAANNVALLAICTFKSISIPGNMIQVIIANGGVSEMKEILLGNPSLQCQRVYLWENGLRAQLDKLLSDLTSPQDDRKYLCRDYNALIFELDSLLDWYKP